MDDILARRVEAVDNYLAGGPVHADDGLGALAASDAVLREAGQREWREDPNCIAKAERDLDCICHWVYVVPESALAGEEQ